VALAACCSVNIRLLLAWLHLLALAVGLAGMWSRARALRDSLRDPDDHGALRRAVTGDTWWRLAAGLWLVTGTWRLLAGTEKHTSYYMANHAFQVKMGLFLAIVVLEIWPMRTLVRWRRGTTAPSPRDAGRIEAISYVQCVLVVAMVLAAASTARGDGAPVASDRTGAVVRETHGAATASAVSPAPAVATAGSGVVTTDDISLLSTEIASPLDGIDLTALHSNFDERRGGGVRRHEALDLMAPRRTPIRAAATGRVLKLFRSVAGGLMIYAADSSERWILMYAHLDGYAPGLRDGDVLARGQVIGFVGSTGNAAANAPHLHFAIARSADVTHWSKGTPIDPLPVLRAAAAAAQRRR
jgi:uncharacterized membrane protein